MNMKERLARRIAVAELGDKDQSAIELFWPRFMKHADAVLDELRVPDEGMLMAVLAVIEARMNLPGPRPALSGLGPHWVREWQAAIDKAREC